MENTLAIPAPEIPVPVTGAMTPAVPVTVDLSRVDADMVARARGGELELTPVNPEDGTGELQVTITDGDSGTSVTQTIVVTPAGDPQVIAVSGPAMREFLGGPVQIQVSGSLGPPALGRVVRLDTVVRIIFELGGRTEP